MIGERNVNIFKPDNVRGDSVSKEGGVGHS